MCAGSRCVLCPLTINQLSDRSGEAMAPVNSAGLSCSVLRCAGAGVGWDRRVFLSSPAERVGLVRPRSQSVNVLRGTRCGTRDRGLCRAVSIKCKCVAGRSVWYSPPQLEWPHRRHL